MKKSKSSALPWLIHKIKRYLPAVCLLALLSAVQAYTYIELALLSETIIDAASAVMETLSFESFTACLRLPQIYKPAFSVMGIIVLQVFLSIVCSNLSVRVGGKIDMVLRQSAFSALLGKEYQQFHRYHSGELMNRLSADVTHVSTGVTGLVPSALSMLTKLIGGLAVLARISPLFTLVLIGLGALLMLCSRLYGRYMKQMHKRCQETEGQTRSFMQESLINLLSIKAFSNEQHMEKRLKRLQQDNFRARVKRNTISNIGNTIIFLLLNGAYYLALVWGVVCLIAGTLTFGTLTALLQIFQQLKLPLRNASSLLPQYYSMMASAERLQEVEQLENEEIPLNDAEKEQLRKTFSAFSATDLSFAYDGESPVLEHVDFTVRKGEIVALMGESGVGKSTLMKLVLTILQPTTGALQVHVGDTALPLNASVRPLFSYVPQGNAVIAGTLRENVAFFREGLSDEAIIHALSLACLDEFIGTLPDGLDTVVGERGFDLSEGQAQRIAIARALLNDAPVLLLDECTSALDNDTESTLLTNIKKLTDKTVLMISHRTAAIHGCDRVWRLQNRRITANE